MDRRSEVQLYSANIAREHLFWRAVVDRAHDRLRLPVVLGQGHLSCLLAFVLRLPQQRKAKLTANYCVTWVMLYWGLYSGLGSRFVVSFDVKKARGVIQRSSYVDR